MKHRTDVYIAFTPQGCVEIDFPEDGGSVFAGPQEAIDYLTDLMMQTTNRMGITMTPANLEPIDLVGSCQPDGSGILIMEPPDEVVQFGSVLDGEPPD